MSNTSIPPGRPDEDISGLSDRELSERLFREVVQLRQEVRTVKYHHKATDANVGLVMNSVHELCRVRGLKEHADHLSAAMERWSERRRAEAGNGSAHVDDLPTNPDNAIPEPPDET